MSWDWATALRWAATLAFVLCTVMASQALGLTVAPWVGWLLGALISAPVAGWLWSDELERRRDRDIRAEHRGDDQPMNTRAVD